MADQPVAIVMAAGKSTRMKSELPKVLHHLCGRPLLAYVIDALREAGIGRIVVVVGYRADAVREAFADEPGLEFVLQAEQKGTGHAAMVCQSALAKHDGPVVVLAGDGPMIRPELIRSMLDHYQQHHAKAFLASAVVANPFGLGRIVRDANGQFAKIVEHKDASDAEKQITEINPSFYVFDNKLLFDALSNVRPNNAQGEYYITDVPGILRGRGEKVVAETLADEIDMFGVNHRGHLAEAHGMMQQRIQAKLMDSGVTIVDPKSTVIDARAKIGQDTIIHPFTVISGPTTIGQRCSVGPFAHLRGNVTLADEVHVGAFVELVRTSVGAHSRARHHAYLGDAVVGANVNVGAGVITANFDGQKKHGTTIADGAKLGAGSILIAPVAVGAGAVLGAGAVVTKGHDVPAHQQVVGVPARPVAPRKKVVSKRPVPKKKAAPRTVVKKSAKKKRK